MLFSLAAAPEFAVILHVNIIQKYVDISQKLTCINSTQSTNVNVPSHDRVG